MDNVMHSFIRDLREYDEYAPPTETWPSTGDMISHAAEELERLSAEVKRLAIEDEYNDQALDRYWKENKRLIAENKHNIDVLKQISRHFGSVEQCREIASWALERVSTERECSQDGINDRGSDEYANPERDEKGQTQ